METMENTKVIEAVSVSGEALAELLTGAASHAHQKSDLTALNAVRLATIDVTLTAEASDRYRLVRGAIGSFIVENESATLAESVISLSDVKRVIALCKSLAKRQAVTLTRSGDLLSVSSGGDSLTLSVLDVKVPSFNQFLEPIANPAALTSLFFNPKYFGDIAKLCGKSAGKQGVKVTFGLSEAKAYQFTAKGEAVEWHGAIMPMREYK